MPVCSDGIYKAKSNRMKVAAGSFCVPRMLVGEFEKMRTVLFNQREEDNSVAGKESQSDPLEGSLRNPLNRNSVSNQNK